MSNSHEGLAHEDTKVQRDNLTNLIFEQDEKAVPYSVRAVILYQNDLLDQLALTKDPSERASIIRQYEQFSRDNASLAEIATLIRRKAYAVMIGRQATF